MACQYCRQYLNLMYHDAGPIVCIVGLRNNLHAAYSFIPFLKNWFERQSYRGMGGWVDGREKERKRKIASICCSLSKWLWWLGLSQVEARIQEFFLGLHLAAGAQALVPSSAFPGTLSGCWVGIRSQHVQGEDLAIEPKCQTHTVVFLSLPQSTWLSVHYYGDCITQDC